VGQATLDDPLRAGRAALERHAWQEAFERFSDADAVSQLAPADLEALAQAAWWCGRIDDTIHARERAYAGYLDQGNPRRAGLVALDLRSDHARRLSGSIAASWYRRAERLLEPETDSVEHGHLLLARARQASGDSRLEEAATLANEAVQVGARYGDKELQAHALMEEGMSRVAAGEVVEGLALVDEATMAAVSGELSPLATGIVYCNTISTCANLADYRRAGEWTEAAQRWCDRQAISGFPGICRVHRAEIIRLRGNWVQAEEEATQACTELRNHGMPLQASAGFYEIGEIRLRMGDLAAAGEAFAQAHELGHQAQPGITLLRLAEGKVDAAGASIARALDEEREPLARARLLPAALEVALKRDEPPAARAAAVELREIAERFGSTALHAAAETAEAAVALAGGDTTTAVRAARSGWQRWQELDAPYEAARARVLLGLSYVASGDPDAGHMEITAARSTFERLGAIPDARRAEDLLRPEDAAVERVARTFLFTDIVGSTNLVEAVGDEAWEDLVGWHDRTLRALFAEHEGEEVDHSGDGFFVAFADAGSALRCAVAIQRSLAEHRRSHGFAPQVRVGAHASDATKRAGDYGGRGVHEAARIGALAGGGEILASASTVEAAGTGWEGSEPREVTLRGISTPVTVVSVSWRSATP
jgi:class 3 adenylate cyclase